MREVHNNLVFGIQMINNMKTTIAFFFFPFLFLFLWQLEGIAQEKKKKKIQGYN